MKDKRKLTQLSAGLRQRTQEAYDQREDRRRGILDWNKVGSMPMFTPDVGEHLIDVLPYFAGPNDPRKSEGSPTFYVDLYVHRFMGLNEDDFICLARTYNKPCAICEYRNELRKIDDPSEDIRSQIGSLRPKRYTVYAIWDRDNESKGVQLWTIAHWFFQNNLLGITKRPRKEGVIAFADYTAKEGRSISFEIAGKAMQRQFKSFQFVERDEDIPEEILEQVPVLDELLDIPEPEEVAKAFMAGLPSEQEPEATRDELATRRMKKEDICPFGGTMGENFEEFEECLSVCDKYQRCYELFEASNPATVEEEPETGTEPDEDPEPEPEPTPTRTPIRRRRRE